MDERLLPIFSRRSVRDFTGAEVVEPDVRALLEAGMAAPSASNRKPWHFVTVTDRRKLDRLAEIHPYAKMLSTAGLCIAVCGDKTVSPDYWVQDCSAATENILIAASLLGLGSVWLGVHPRPDRETEITRFLGVPDDIGLLCLIAVGHPAANPAPRTQPDPGRIHKENW
jgi:nitroreductase